MSPVSRRHLRPRRARTASTPVRGPEDALDVILLAASQPPQPETVCLLLDHAHRGLGVVTIGGAGGSDHLGELADILLAAPEQRGLLSAVVLATVRPDRSHLPTPGDELAWFALLERFDGAGVELLDWFVLARGLASSLCELTDSSWRWSADPP